MSHINHWHDSDPSEEEAPYEAQSQSAARKRSSRACDQCRKTKSKCERSADGSPCKSCAIAGTICTFLGPSYKRGPPKGYIHAIEQRWHQVESLLGAIIQCPSPAVQSIVADLRQDDLAREIINRVDKGPYGPSGRLHQPAGATKEDFFASILRSNESRDQAARSRRQSRVSREIVSSNQDNGLSIVPTVEWQDNLSNRLASSPGSSVVSSPMSYSRLSTPGTFDGSGEPLTQRRRLNTSVGPENRPQPDWNDMYTLEEGSDYEDCNSDDAAEALGQLSLDENQEVRFHGKASGLHLLNRNDRTDDRNEGGIWRMPMARVWPPSKHKMTQLLQEEDVNVSLPSIEVQDHLIELYFTYIHPTFPVLHKARFLAEYNAKNLRDAGGEEVDSPASTSTPKPETFQKVSRLLLLSIFSIAARFSDHEMPLPPQGKMWEAGSDYLNSALAVLTKAFHRSRSSTVQSLLILGHREFGMGSMEQAWIYIGMAIRMAIDLGLNRNAEKWKLNGLDLFSADEKQTRRQIWWTCCLADRYGSVYMGRPVAVKESDFDTPLPGVFMAEEDEAWSPLPADIVNRNYVPVPGRVMSSFCAAATLSVIVGSIMSAVYPVRVTARLSRRALLAKFESQLDQWYIDLPEGLRYDSSSKRMPPPPTILFLHIRYWGAVLLLHRAFIPNWKGEPISRNTCLEADTIGLKAFDLSQGAASHISALVTVYLENFTMKRASPFLSSYILSAGIMHILTLTLRPSNLQASLGLRQSMIALREMEVVWPSASRAWDLLNGVKIGFDNYVAPLSDTTDRHKRHAEDAFGEKSSDYLQREAFSTFNEIEQAPPITNGVQDLNTRMMAHMLGLDIPGIQPSTSYYPGYEWWPRPKPDDPSSHHSITSPMNLNDHSSGITYDRQAVMDDWLQQGNSQPNPGFSYDFALNQFGI